MKIFRWLFLLLTLILPWNHALAVEPLRIATEGAYPPFNAIDASGKLVGFDVDIAMALCEAMDTECTIEAVAWEKLLDGLAAGSFDVIVASMAKTPEREQIADFTGYYYRSRTAFIGDPTKPFIQTRDGLSGMILATQAGTVQEQHLIDNFSGSAIIKTTPTINDSLILLAQGEADAVLADNLIGYDFLQTDAGKRFDFVGTPMPAKDPNSEAAIAVRKGEADLVKALNEALKTIRLSGMYDKINRKYFPFSIY